MRMIEETKIMNKLLFSYTLKFISEVNRIQESHSESIRLCAGAYGVSIEQMYITDQSRPAALNARRFRILSLQ